VNAYALEPTKQNQTEDSSAKKSQEKANRKPGKQLGVKGFGRKQTLQAEAIIPHYIWMKPIGMKAENYIGFG
jgi:hypothetical protein